jgi:hypothetical protein
MKQPITNKPVNKIERYQRYAELLFAMGDVSFPAEQRLLAIDALEKEISLIQNVEVRSDIVAAEKHLDFLKTALKGGDHKLFRETIEKANLHLFRVQMRLIELSNKPPKKEDWE